MFQVLALFYFIILNLLCVQCTCDNEVNITIKQNITIVYCRFIVLKLFYAFKSCVLSLSLKLMT